MYKRNKGKIKIEMAKENKKMSFNATWSMAVGGMVGGGIISVLGVIISIAGQWAWLSFVLAGLIALISAFSYNQLSIKYKQSGGAFTFLNVPRPERSRQERMNKHIFHSTMLHIPGKYKLNTDDKKQY